MILDAVDAHTEGVLDQLLVGGVLIPNVGAVRGYMRQYPDIAAPLPRVYAATRNYVGPDAQLSLDVYRDPEVDDSYLTLYARQQQYDEHIVDGLETVAAAFDGEFSKTSGWLLITTDFAPPQ